VVYGKWQKVFRKYSDSPNVQQPGLTYQRLDLRLRPDRFDSTARAPVVRDLHLLAGLFANIPNGGDRRSYQSAKTHSDRSTVETADLFHVSRDVVLDARQV
jgi:hypothetical protein